MTDRTIVVESRTVLSQFGVRENAFAARVAITAPTHTRKGGEIASTVTEVVATNVTKFLQISVEKPMDVRLTISGGGGQILVLRLTEHLVFTAAVSEVALINPVTDVSAPPISYRIMFA